MFRPPAEEPVIAAITLIDTNAVINGFAYMFTSAVVMLSHKPEMRIQRNQIP